MKKLFLFICLKLCLLNLCFAQNDSARITHTQEVGTLEKQQFINKYDYAFTAKAPSKWLVKGFGAIGNVLNSRLADKGYIKKAADFRIGIERKLSPSFSLTIDAAHNQTSILRDNGYADHSYYGFLDGVKHWFASAELRWYVDIVNRIKQEENGNNFSGSYLSLKVDKVWHNETYIGSDFYRTENKWDTDYFRNYYKSQISLNYGMQRRFLRYGLVDFSVGLSRNTEQQIHRHLTFSDGDNSYSGPLNRATIQESISSSQQNNWTITTDLKIGIGFADFKKSTKIPPSEIVQCIEIENETRMWKIAWPRMKLNATSQILDGSIGYEQKIAQSAFSINTYLNFSFFHAQTKNTDQYNPTNGTFFKGNGENTTISGILLIQPRWYILMNRRVHLGKAGNNLTGVYTGLNNIFSSSHWYTKNDRYTINGSYNPLFVSTGLMIGYQRKLFKNGFIDLNVSKGLVNHDFYYHYLMGHGRLIFDLKLGFAL
ncbi:hypothetical protein [Runella sp.]|uniref:hypothetical protein n=1 Tax=Runella sp. TaxID=1960881 RepID=UPI003D10B74C